jgi:hypothetical protein
MKLNKNLKYVLLLATVGVTISTALWLKKQYAKLMKNTYKVKSFLIKKASLDAVTFDIVYAYENNTDIDINLVGQKYDIYVDNKFITQIKSDVPVILKANAVSDIPLTITVNPKVIPNEVVVNVLCNSLPPLCNGSITLNPTPTGTGIFTYQWSIPGTTNAQTNLCSGNYAVDITDSYSCTYNFPYTLTVPPAMISVPSVNPVKPYAPT